MFHHLTQPFYLEVVQTSLANKIDQSLCPATTPDKPGSIFLFILTENVTSVFALYSLYFALLIRTFRPLQGGFARKRHHMETYGCLCLSICTIIPFVQRKKSNLPSVAHSVHNPIENLVTIEFMSPHKMCPAPTRLIITGSSCKRLSAGISPLQKKIRPPEIQRADLLYL